MPLIVLLPAFFAALYVFWRLRYGPPRSDVPRALCFHKISDRFCWEGTWTTPARFFGCVDALLEKGYRFIGEQEYLSRIESPASDSRNLVFLTFDDGYREVFTVVFPGLQKRRVPFHVFVPTEYCGRRNSWDLSLGRRPFTHLSWTEIEEMSAAGVTFGSHGATHSDLTRLAPAELSRELEQSKRAIEEHVGTSVKTLSYPFGRYNAEVKSAAVRAGYEYAFTLYPGHPNARIDRLALGRAGVYVIDPAGLVEIKLKPNPLFWVEEMKCRIINKVAVLTPLFKSLARGRGSRR